MSTRHDRNYRSWDSEDQHDDRDVTLWPTQDPAWPRGSWQDTAKFHRRSGRKFENFRIVDGGEEDAVDISPACVDNEFRFFRVASGGSYVLTLKGGSSRNILSDWTIDLPGQVVDIEIGNWSSSNFDACKGNTFLYWKRADNLPITYCYRLGCRPTFWGMPVKHLWWRSVGLTAYWWAKYLWHVVLGRPDK